MSLSAGVTQYLGQYIPQQCRVPVALIVAGLALSTVLIAWC
jgi:hypothetical protein